MALIETITNIVVLLAMAVSLVLVVVCVERRNTPAALGWGIAAMWAAIHLFSRSVQ